MVEATPTQKHRTKLSAKPVNISRAPELARAPSTSHLYSSLAPETPRVTVRRTIPLKSNLKQPLNLSSVVAAVR